MLLNRNNTFYLGVFFSTCILQMAFIILLLRRGNKIYLHGEYPMHIFP